MAKCDEGYFCAVCGNDVADITVSDLYLRYVTGMIVPEVLHTTPERHLRCNPILAQFIVHPEFEPVVVEGDFDRRNLAPDIRSARDQLITRGWLRLQEIREILKTQELAITDYPLLEVRETCQSL
jgi:hypothetical protein